MSPVFGHGRLRLYLLKLLDEAPRHGYEVIRLLQDRFMGVYAPSPGTIYPRLARLEEEGFLTHEEANGRKIYRITDKGREEINRRLGELDELEQEITESVTREVRTEDRRSAHERALQARDEAREHARQVREEMREAHTGDRDMSGEHGRQDDDAGAGRNWSDWTGWQDWTRWTDWPGRRRRGRDRGAGGAGPDFEGLAREFGNEVRQAIRQAGALGEGAMEELRTILEDALERIRTDVFGAAKQRPADTGSADERRPSEPGGPRSEGRQEEPAGGGSEPTS